ncbi:MAG: DinB family protein [Pirellulaceae bacterium]|nr:DinB family protein [Pirellulaceae bacterium]
MSLSDRLTIAIRQIESAREYTLNLLQDLGEDEWYWTPTPAFSTVAWQVGHLAMAEYGLCLFRQRGRAEVDSELMSGAFRKKFMRGTTPGTSREDYPSRNEILQVLQRVHEQVLQELPNFDGPALDEPMDRPYFGFATRYGSLLFAGHHEMIHAGQIGVLRRLMGKSPLA